MWTMINIFQFKPQEIKIWPFLKLYEEKLYKWLESNSISNDQLIRHAIVGFFPHYRRCNHEPIPFRTAYDKENHNLSQRIQNQFDIFNKLNGKPITSTQEYLKIFGLEYLKNLTPDCLFDYVVHGTLLKDCITSEKD